MKKYNYLISIIILILIILICAGCGNNQNTSQASASSVISTAYAASEDTDYDGYVREEEAFDYVIENSSSEIVDWVLKNYSDIVVEYAEENYRNKIVEDVLNNTYDDYEWIADWYRNHPDMYDLLQECYNDYSGSESDEQDNNEPENLVVGEQEQLPNDSWDEDYEMLYVLNTESHIFHYQSCHQAQRIGEDHRKEKMAFRDDLISDGYKPCGICNP